MSTFFRAPVQQRLGSSVHALNMIPGPQGLAVMLPTSNDDRWVFAQSWDPQTQRVEDFTRERVTAMIRAASGIPDLPIEILDVGALLVRRPGGRPATGSAGRSSSATPPTGSRRGAAPA